MIPGLQMIPDREWSLNWTADLSRACRKHSGSAFSRLSANGSLLTSNWDISTFWRQANVIIIVKLKNI